MTQANCWHCSLQQGTHGRPSASLRTQTYQYFQLPLAIGRHYFWRNQVTAKDTAVLLDTFRQVNKIHLFIYILFIILL